MQEDKGDPHAKNSPFLWFNNQAEEAAKFYTFIFKNSRIVSVMESLALQLEVDAYHSSARSGKALNGGPQFKFTPAISLFVNCETQQEVDELWGKLTAGGKESRCGWLEDKYGLSWQIIPTVLGEVLGSKDRAKANKALQAMLQMDKIDIAAPKRAYEQ